MRDIGDRPKRFPEFKQPRLFNKFLLWSFYYEPRWNTHQLDTHRKKECMWRQSYAAQQQQSYSLHCRTAQWSDNASERGEEQLLVDSAFTYRTLGLQRRKTAVSPSYNWQPPNNYAELSEHSHHRPHYHHHHHHHHQGPGCAVNSISPNSCFL